MLYKVHKESRKQQKVFMSLKIWERPATFLSFFFFKTQHSHYKMETTVAAVGHTRSVQDSLSIVSHRPGSGLWNSPSP